MGIGDGVNLAMIKKMSEKALTNTSMLKEMTNDIKVFGFDAKVAKEKLPHRTQTLEQSPKSNDER